MRARRAAAVAATMCLLIVLVAGCGKSTPVSNAGPTVPGVSTTGTAPACPATETVNLAKTKFVLHAGLAGGAFYHWIFQPWRNGDFHGFHRFAAVVKAGLAAAFVVHEINQARIDAHADPALCKALIAPIDEVRSAMSRAVHGITRGNPSASDLNPVDQGLSSLKQQSSVAGAPVTDQTPSATQLAHPSSTGG